MEWNVRRGARQCFICEKEFGEGDEYMSLLVEAAEDDFQRRDTCPDHWNDKKNELTGEVTLISFWRSHVPRKKENPKELKLNIPALWNFFLRLEKPKTRLEENFRYIIAVMLMRKKMLTLNKEIKKDSREIWVFASTKDEKQTYAVLRPELSEADILRLTEELKQLSGNE